MKGIELIASEGKALKRTNEEGKVEYCRGGYFTEERAKEYTECPLEEYLAWQKAEEERLAKELKAEHQPEL